MEDKYIFATGSFYAVLNDDEEPDPDVPGKMKEVKIYSSRTAEVYDVGRD